MKILHFLQKNILTRLFKELKNNNDNHILLKYELYNASNDHIYFSFTNSLMNSNLQFICHII